MTLEPGGAGVLKTLGELTIVADTGILYFHRITLSWDTFDSADLYTGVPIWIAQPGEVILPLGWLLTDQGWVGTVGDPPTLYVGAGYNPASDDILAAIGIDVGDEDVTTALLDKAHAPVVTHHYRVLAETPIVASIRDSSAYPGVDPQCSAGSSDIVLVTCNPTAA